MEQDREREMAVAVSAMRSRAVHLVGMAEGIRNEADRLQEAIDRIAADRNAAL